MTASGPGRPDAERDLLRHTLATMVYRGAKTLRDAPAGFASFRIPSSDRAASGAATDRAASGAATDRAVSGAATGTRTPGEILAHIGDLLDWALELARGRHTWKNSAAPSWEEGVARFFQAAERLDAELAASQTLGCAPGRLFQGPIADALTHFGQLAMLRRLAGAPVKGENYFKADIAAGRVGSDQAAPRVEFD
jgi:hypothetical protein